MIVEYISLIDLKKVFNKEKHIIYVSKDIKTDQVKDSVPNMINDFKQQLFLRNDKFNADNSKKAEAMEKSNRIVLKGLNSIKTQMNNH